MVFQQEIETQSAEETFDWAKRLGEALSFPFVVFLKGAMGAGKTLITSGIVKGLGLKDDVSSPTYTIVNEYHGQQVVYHFDLYRLSDVDELYEMGFEDYLSDGGGLIFEWPDLIEKETFDRCLVIKIESTLESDRKRRITATTTDLELSKELNKLR